MPVTAEIGLILLCRSLRMGERACKIAAGALRSPLGVGAPSSKKTGQIRDPDRAAARAGSGAPSRSGGSSARFG